MLDAIPLSEEELTVLFAPASHGASLSMLRPEALGRKPPSSHARVSAVASKSSATSRKKKMRGSKVSSGRTPVAVVPARCGYRTGKCQNLQAIKRNGKLHKLCEFHRERANLNQKKLDRKKRMQRSKRPSAESKDTCEDDAKATVDRADRSPRTVDAMVTSEIFFKTEPGLDAELFLPTSLDEAPLALGCEELAIFCSLMTFDANYQSRDPPPVRTAPCHYYTGIV